MELNNLIAAIITGGGSGLGEGTARALAAKGVKVGIFDVNEEGGNRVAKEIGGVFAKVDVADTNSVAEGIKLVRETHGQENICVNCAGVGWAAKTVDREGNPHDSDLFNKIIGINLIGTFNVASQSAAGMCTQDPITDDGERGVIINTASVAAFEYGASKAAVAGMTLPMARDLSRNGVRVMTIAPGIFGTPMVQGMPQEVQDALGAMIPFPSRLGKPVEYAQLALSICENPLLNGETIRLDGAIRMAPK